MHMFIVDLFFSSFFCLTTKNKPQTCIEAYIRDDLAAESLKSTNKYYKTYAKHKNKLQIITCVMFWEIHGDF